MKVTAYTGQSAINEWIKQQQLKERIGESERKHKIAAAKLLAKTKIAGKEFAKWNLATLIAPPMRTPITITNDILSGPMTINRRQGGKTSIKTRNNYLSHFKEIFKFCVASSYLSVNPIDHAKIDAPQGYQEDLKAEKLNPQVIYKVMDAVDNTFSLVYYTAIATGMRQGEQRALMWKHINFEEGIIRIEQAVKLAKCGEEIGVPKTRGSTREIPMSEKLSKSLKKEYLKQGRPQDNKFVFSNRNNAPIQGKVFRKNLEKAIEKSNVAAFTWHDLRHFFASILFDKFGSDYYIVSQLLGHESVEFTKKQYVHWFKDEDRDNRVRQGMAQAGI
tara:strand:+ start:820 stop:1815 length:996 start_codon:yes stop_codon:yes gene_type:complete